MFPEPGAHWSGRCWHLSTVRGPRYGRSTPKADLPKRWGEEPPSLCLPDVQIALYDAGGSENQSEEPTLPWR
jgi:hypothetical protein